MPISNWRPQTPSQRKPNGVPASKKLQVQDEPRELTEDEMELLEGLRNGSTDFDKVQREVAARAFEKILRDPKALKVKDWLTSELIKIKKEESNAKIGAMEVFVRKMFSGTLPNICPHCGHPIFQEGEIEHADAITAPVVLA